MKFSKSTLRPLFALFFLTLFYTSSKAATYYWVGGTSNTWALAASWNTALNGSGSSAIPTATDDVIFDASNIGGGTPATGSVTVTFGADATINSVTLLGFTSNTVTFQPNTTNDRTLTISANSTLVPTGNTLIIAGNTNRNLTVRPGTANGLTIDGTVRVTSGTTGHGIISNNTATGTLTFSATGIYNHQKNSGTSPSATWASGSQFNWNVPSQTANLTLSSAITGSNAAVSIINSNGFTLSPTGTNAIASLSIGASGLFNINTANITVAGTTTVNGTLSDGSGTGANTFTGLVTVNGTMSGAGASNTTFTAGLTNNGTYSAALAATFAGGITNNGTFAPTGASTFSATQTLGGSNPYSFGGSITVNTGVVATFSNNVTLNPGGSVNMAGTGTYSFSGNLTIASGTVTGSAANIVNIGGNLSVSIGAIYDISQSRLTVTGTTTVDGTLTDGNNVGTSNIFTGLVTVNGTLTGAGNTVTTYTAGLTNNGTYTAVLAATFSGVFTNAGSFTSNGSNTYAAGITNNGTFAPTGASTFSATQTLGGTNAYNFRGNLTVNAGTTTTFSNSVTFNPVAGISLLGTGTYAFSGNVIVSTGTVTGAAVNTVNIGGTLSVSTGATYDISQSIFAVTGTTTVDGTLSDGNTLGTSNTFTGLVTVNGTLSGAGATATSYNGGLTNTGTYSAALAATFNTSFSNAGTFTSGGTNIFNVAVLNSNSFTPSGVSTFASGVTNNGTFAPTGASTFSATQTLGGSNAYNFRGSLTVNTGVTTTFSNNVTFNPTAAITLNGTGTYSFSGNVVVSTNTVTGNAANTVNIAGSLSVSTGATYDIGQSTLSVTGTTTVDGTLTDGSGTGTNTFTGLVTVNGTLSGAGTSTTTYTAGLTNNGNYTAALAATFSGAFTNVGSFTSNGSNTYAAGISNNGTFAPTGASTFSATQTLGGSNAYNFRGNLTVNTGITTTFSNNVTFNPTVGITLNGTGTYAFSGNVVVSTNTVTGNAANTVNIAGSLSVSGGATFNVGQSTLSVIGLTTVDGSFLDNSNTGTNTLSDVTVNGTWNNTSTSAFNISGNLIISPVAFTSGASVYTLSGISKTITGTGTPTFTSLTVSGSYTQSINSLTATTLNLTGAYTNNTALTTTTLNVNAGGILNTAANLTTTTATIANGGELDINAGVTFTVTTSVANSGIFKVVGANGNPANVTRVGGTYTITQAASTGVFHAQYYTFTNAAITISDGSIDGTNNFSDGSFSSNAGTPGTYLTLAGTLTFADFTASNVVFNSGTATANVARTSGTGVVTFANATGALSGYGFENDAPANGQLTGNVRWTSAAATYYWVGGAVATNWNAAGVWATTLGGTGVASFSPSNADVFILDGSNIGAGATGNVTVNVNANYTVGSIRVLNFGANQVTMQPATGAALTYTLTLAPASVDVFTVASGNTLNITGNTTTRNLTLAIGTNCTATIDGTISVNTNSGIGSLSGVTTANTTFGSTAIYIHNINGGTIPNATWNATSELRVTGTVATTPTFTSGQTFGNLTWNAPSQTSVTGLNVAALTVNGLLNVVSTGGSGALVLSSATTASSVTSGSFQMAAGRFYLLSSTLNGSLTVNGSFTQTGGTVDLASASTGVGTFTLSGDLTQSGSSVIQRTAGAVTSALVFNGLNTNLTTVPGGIGAGVNVTLNKTASTNTLTLLSAASLPTGTTLALTSGVLALNGNTLTLGATQTISRNSNASILLGGGTLTHGTTTNLSYSGSSDISTGAELPTGLGVLGTFGINMGSAATKVTLSANGYANGNVNVAAGTFDLSSFTFDRNSGTPTFTLAATTTLLVGNSFPTGYNTYTLTGSLVNYNGAAQTIAGVTYGGLTMSGSGIKTLGAAATGAGTITVSSGITFRIGGSLGFPTFGTQTLTGSTVEYNGTAQTVSAVPYHDLIVSGTASNTASVTVSNNMTVSGTHTLAGNNITLTVTGNLVNSGSVLYSATNNQTLTVTGNLSGNGIVNMTGANTKILNLGGSDNSGFTGTFTAASGTVNYTRTGSQILFAGAYNTLAFTNSGARNLSGNSTVAQNFTVPANVAFSLNGYNFTSTGTSTATGTISVPASSVYTATGNITVTASTGTFEVLNNGTLYANGGTITNNNVFKATGLAGQPATVTTSNLGYFVINQANATAVFHASYYTFDRLGNTGITISLGTIDPTNNFNNGSFSNSSGTLATHAYLTLSGITISPDITAQNVSFGTPAGILAKNVIRQSGTGSITFLDYSGAWAGQAYETDNTIPGIYINWGISGSTFYSQATAGFYSLATWNSAANGSGSQPASLAKLTDGSSSFIVQSPHVVTVDNNLSIKDITVQNGGSLVVGDNTTARTVDVNGTISVLTGGNVSVGASNAVHTINFTGSTLTNDGTFNLYASAVRAATFNFNGVTMTVAGGTSPVFANINLNNQVPPYTNSLVTAAVPLTIKGNVSFAAGAQFADGGLVHTVGGNWTYNATASMTGTGTIEFVGPGVQFVNTASTFHNVTFKSANAAQLSGVVTVNGAFYVTSNTAVSTAVGTHILNGDFTVDNGSSFTQSAGTINFASASAAQAIDFNNATFAIVQFNGAGVKNTANGLTATGGVTIANTAVVNGSGSHFITGGLTINGTCNWDGQVTMLNGTLTSANATVTLPATLVAGAPGGTSVTLNNTAPTITLNLGGDLLVNSGNFVMNPNATLVGSAGKSLNVANAANLYLRGANNFPSGFDTYNFATGSNTRYDGTVSPQQVAGNVAYHHLYLQTNTKDAVAPIVVKGDLNFSNAGIATIFNLGTFAHSVAGNISNANVSSVQGSAGARLTMNNQNADQSISLGTYNIDTLSFTLDSSSTTRTKTIASGANVTTKAFLATNLGGSASNRLIVNIGTNQINSSASSVFNIGANVSLYTTGQTSLYNMFDTGNPLAFSAITLDPLSTVRYNNTTLSQTIANKAGLAYGSIELVGSTQKIATSALDVNGDLVTAGNTPVFIDGGFNHTVAGNWSLATTNYSIALGSSGTITLDGLDQSVIGSVVNLVCANGGTKTLSTGNLAIGGNLTINSGVAMDANIRNITIDGNWTQLGTGVFTQSTGTTTFQGISASDQTIGIGTPANSYFGNLTLVRGNLTTGTPSANVRIVTNSSVKVGGVLRVRNYNNGDCSVVTSFAELDITDDTLYVAGSVLFYPKTTLLSTNSTFVMNGELDQEFYLGNSTGLDAVQFNHLTFAGSGTKTLINGGVVNNNAACGNWNSTYTVNGNLNIDLATVSASNRPLVVYGNWVNTGDFQHAGTVTMAGTGKTISNSTFYALLVSGTYTLGGDITVNNALTINGGLDVSASNYSITLVGAYSNTGTFTARQGTFNVTSGGANFASGGTGVGKKLYNLVVTNTACGANTSLTDSINVENDLTINSGVLTTGVYNVRVGKNFYNYDQFNQSNGTSRLTFDPIATGTRAFVCTTSTAACGVSTYRNIVVNAPSAKIVQDGNFILTAGILRIDAGTYKLQGNTIDFSNSAASLLTINAGATIEVDSGSSLLARNTITNLGTFKLVGVTGLPATLGSCTGCTANFSLLQNDPSAVLHAKNYQVQSSVNSTTYLVDIQNGILDAVNNLSNGVYSCVTTTGTSSYIRFGTNAPASNITLNGVVFNSGKLRNVEKTAGATTVSFQNATGALAGAAFETDVPANGATTGSVRWSYVGAKFWDGGAATSNWSDAANWTGDAVPLASDTVFIDNSIVPGTYTINLDAAVDTARSAKLIVQRTSPSVITINLNSKPLLVKSDISVSVGCVINGNTGNMFVGGSWSNSGTFNPGTSTVHFAGKGSGYSVANGTSSFYDVWFKGTNGSAYSLGSTFNANNVTINANNTLDVSPSAFSLNISGDWLNNGTFNPRSGSVSIATFNRAGNQSITNGPFNNFITSGSGTKQFQTSMTVYRTVTIGAGTILDVQANSMYVGLNWVNNASSGFTQASDQYVYFNGVNQSIDNGTATTTFQNVALLGTGTKTLFKNSVVNGEFLVASAGLTFNMQDNQLVGNASTSQFVISSNSTVLVGGTGTFLSNFVSTNLSTNSTVRYQPFSAAYDGVTQNILSLPNNGAYGNLDLRVRTSVVSTTTKSLGDNLYIAGNLTINDVYTQLNVNSYTINLTGNLGFPAGGLPINWGANGTLVHDGTGLYNWQTTWNIDADLTSFNNLVLSGSQRKNLNSNVSIAGNLTVQSSVIFDMNTFTVTGTAGKTMLMQNGASIESAIASPALAFPLSFGTYNLDAASTTYLNGDGAQDIYSSVTYGNLSLQNTNTSSPLRLVRLLSSDLNVLGNLNFTNTTFTDGGYNLYVRGNFFSNDAYVPSASSKLTLNGDNQVVQNPLNGGTMINLNKLTVTGTGIKTMGNGAITINIADTLFIDTSLTMNSTRPIVFSGTFWNNQGLYSNTSSTSFANTNPLLNVTVNPGPASVGNNFGVVNFNMADTLFFVHNGGDFNGAFNINSGVVNMGNGLTHTMAGALAVYSVSPSPFYSNHANLTFDGGGQSIPVEIIANDVVCANAGTKTMTYSWYTNNLTINSGVTLSNASSDSLFVEGNFTNNGGYTANLTTLVMNSNGGVKTLAAGASNLYDLSIAPTLASTILLTSASTRVSRSVEVKNNGKFKLNSNTLIHGNTGIGAGTKTFVVQVGSTLEVDTNANLLFDNRTSVASMVVDGTLKLLGSPTEIATISRSNTGGQTVTVNGTLQAEYYLIEYMSTAGLQLGGLATIDAVHNLSNGTFSNLNATLGSAYITSNIISTPTNITNVTFNYVGVPAIGSQFNCKQLGSSTITFVSPILGTLACPTYKQGNVVLPNCSVAIWTGLVNNDWNTAGNWSTVTVPDSLTDVTIPIPSIPNQANLPVVSTTTAAARNITLTNGSLTISSGSTLRATGDVLIGNNVSSVLALTDSTSTIRVKGNWTKATGSFSSGSGANRGVVVFYSNGSVNINNGTTYFGSITFAGAGTYNLIGSTINSTATSVGVRGDVVIQNGTVVPSAGTLFVEGDFVRTGGSYTAVGTVNFTGTINQKIVGATLNNVVLSGANNRYTTGNVSFAGTTSMTAGTLNANTSSVITFGGNVTLALGTTFTDGNSTHLFNGATWTSSGTVSGNGFVRFNAGNQTLNPSNMSGIIFGGTGTKTIAGNVSMTGDLFVLSGITVNTQTFLINCTTGTTMFDVANGSIINVSGANNFPTGFLTYNLGCTSTVNYNSSVLNQTVASVTYGNLSVSNGYPTYSKTLAGSIAACGNLTIAANTTLDVSASNFNINVGGNFINQSNNGSFQRRQGIVTFDGAANQTIALGTSGVTGSKKFHAVTVNKPSGTLSFNSSNTAYINSDLTVTSGTMSLAGPDTVYVGGNLQATGGSFINAFSRLHLKATTVGNYNIALNGSLLYVVDITSSGSNYTLLDNATIYRTFELKSGTLDIGARTLVLGDGNTETANVYGTLKVGAGGSLLLANNESFNVKPSGTFELVGISGNFATVSSTTAGSRYNFNVDGNIKANNYLFEYMRASGVNLSSTAVIAPRPYNFSDGTFTNGTSGGVYLKIENTQDVSTIDSIVNVSFTANPGGGAKNVAKTVAGAGKLVFHNASGSFAGTTYENDPFNLIDWTGNYTLNWTGAQNTDWFNPLNWSPNFVPTIFDNAIIKQVTNQPVINDTKPTAAPAVCKNLTINLAANLTLNSTDALKDLKVASDITIDGILKLTNSQDTISVGGNWQRGASGSVTFGNGSVIFDAGSGVKTLNNRTSTFGNVFINGNATYQLGAATIISKSLVINAGALDVTSSSNWALTVGGNWINSGFFYSRSGSVTLNGACGNVYSLRPGLFGTFNNLTMSGCSTSTYNLTDNSLRINGSFAQNAGVFNVNGLAMYMGNATGIESMTLSGTFNLGQNANLYMAANASLSVQSGGQMAMLGFDSVQTANISMQSTGNFGFTVESGATIAGNHYSISGLNANGLIIRAGATVNSTYNLSNGTFSNGVPSGYYFTFEHSFNPAPATCDTIRKVTFNSGASKNAFRTTGSGCITFKDPTGSLAGFLYEKDELSASSTSGRLRWAYTNPTLYWTGVVDNDWFNPSNWQNAGGGVSSYYPDSLTVVFLDLNKAVGTPKRYPIVRSTNAVCPGLCPTKADARDITMSRTTSLELRDNMGLYVDRNLIMTGSTFTVAAGSNSVLNVKGNLELTNNVSPAVIATLNANNATINVYGAFKANGFFNGGTSTVNMLAPSGNVLLYSPGTNGSGTYSSFYRLILNGGANFQLPTGGLAGYMFVLDSLHIGIGATLSSLSSTNEIVVRGSWTNNGTFTHSNMRVYINTQSRGGYIGGVSTTNFYRLTMNGAHWKILTNNISVSENLYIGSLNATWVDLNGKNVTISGSEFIMSNTSSQLKNGGAGTFTFNSNSGQEITISGTGANKALYNLAKSGSGTLTLKSDIDVDGNVLINSGTISAVNRTMYVGGTWTNNSASAFAPGTGKVIFDGTGQTITRGGGEFFYKLRVSGAGLTLNNNITVADSLVMSAGVINTGSNVLYQSSTTPRVARATNSYVDGNFRKNFNDALPKTFEVGSGGVYTPVTVTPVSSATGQVTVKSTNGDSPNLTAACIDPAKSVNRYWTITKTFGQNINATFNYTVPITDVGVTPGNLELNAYVPTTWSLLTKFSSNSTQLVANNISLSSADYQIAEATPSFTWTGVTSTAWNTASNWCNGVVPISTSDIYVKTPVANMPTVPASYTALARNFSIATGATVSMAASTSALNVYGNWANAGTFTPNMGTVSFVGTTAQSLANTNSGTESFRNLTVNKTGTLTLNADVDISAAGTVLVTSGTLDVAATKRVILRSVAPATTAGRDSTARLGRVTGTITPTSTFTVERFIGSPATRTPYVSVTKPTPTVFLAPSVQNLTAGQWSDDISVLYYPTFSTLSSYSELNGTGATLQDKVNRGWRYVLNNATALPVGTGYMISAGLDNTNDQVSVTGAPYVGNLSVPVTYSATGTQGWNLLGNPYPCEISWEALHSANSALLEPQMYIMDPYNSSTNNKTYYVYQAGTGITVEPRTATGRSNANGFLIASSQAFFVKSKVGGGNVNFTETVKPATFTTPVYSNLREESNQIIRINATYGTYNDQVVLHFRDDAQDGYDVDNDAMSMSSGNISLGLVADGKKLVINGMQANRTSLSVPLVVSSSTSGTKKFKVSEFTAVAPAGKSYFLYDKFNRTYNKVENGTEYQFELNSDPNTTSPERFAIVLGSQDLAVVLGTDDAGSFVESKSIEIHPNPYLSGALTISLHGFTENTLSLEIANVDGKVMYTGFESVVQGQIRLEKLVQNLPAGVYNIKCVDSQNSTTKRLVISK
jgi:hypothetical protein